MPRNKWALAEIFLHCCCEEEEEEEDGGKNTKMLGWSSYRIVISLEKKRESNKKLDHHRNRS
jgi:hypothetical protein